MKPLKIKKIEIQGFKSFADKQILELSPRTNVVVGPNGSGKSNLIDAVNWVLGEQSPRSLRSERMEDIIFSGSTARKPVGMAQVVLHIDNSQGELPLDYHEFTVTRRFFRSGESQFLINKIPCRLKDIRELFMGTGSGKGSLAIMSQGQVDQILNAKPSYRREVFEEAAGISKYRARCQEAKNQLAKLDQDTEMLAGMAADIEHNLNVLKTEAEKAQKYLELRDERRELETLLFTKRGKKLYLEAAVNLWQENSLALSLEKNRLHQRHFENMLAEPANELTLKRAELETISRGAVRLQLEKEHLADRLGIVRDKKSWLDGRVRDSLSFLEKSAQEIEELEKRYNSELENSENLLQEILNCREDNESFEERAKDLHKALTLMEQKAKRTGATYVEILREQAANSNLLSALEKELALNDAERAKIAGKLEEFQANRVNLERKVETDLRARVQKEQQLEKLRKDRSASEAAISRLEQQLNQVFLELQERRDQHGELRSRKRLLEEMHKRYEGYAYPVRELLNRGSSLSGICGVVGDLFDVPEEYRVAIEVALGSKINNIVTETAEDAKAAIGLLKQRNSGRLTFLPLDVLIPGVTPKELGALQEGVIASTVVQVEDKYQGVADYLLGRILLVSDLETGLRLARTTKQRFTIVTLQGEMLHPGGALTGGSLKKTAGGVVGRSKTIEQLSSEIDTLEGTIASVNREKDALERKLEQERQKLRETEEASNRVSLKIQELDMGREYGENQILALEREVGILTEDRERLELEQQENLHRLEELTARKSLLQRRIDRVRIVADLREKKLESLRQEVEAHNTARKNAEINLSALDQKHQYCLQTLDQIQGLRTEMAARHQERTLDYEQCKADALKLQQELNEIENEMLANQEGLSRLSGLHQELEQAITALELREQYYSRLVRKLSSVCNRLEQELAGVKLRLTELKLEIGGFEQSLEEKKGLVLLRVCPDPVPIQRLQVRVAAVRRQMQDLEPVNLSSIEEYSRIAREREGLKEKVEDIRKTQEHLRQLVNILERRMKHRFRDFFSRLQVTFNETYLRVFGGGFAELQIQDDDVLEGAIDIMVQPPGKRIQSLLLLSGGERALTALTLLFAIIQENHNPFCILDEVDTSLDENNIEHFTDLLEYYSQITQFIVVSHRQGTMEAADSLFGVTMPEDGVSTVVSVNLEREVG